METENSRNIILASGSPRRFELMTRIGFVPRVVSADVEEIRGEQEPPEEYTRRLALEKALWVAERETDSPEEWILAADTVVVFEGDVLEKPVDSSDAIAMLTRMSGKWHIVVTSFCWLSKSGTQRVETVKTRVEMRPLTEKWIRRYVATGEPMDKAGSYGIQEIGATIVRGIVGSYFCVMGLPVCEVVEVLQELGGVQEFPFGD